MRIILENLIVSTVIPQGNGDYMAITRPDQTGIQFSPAPPTKKVILQGIKVVDATPDVNGNLLVTLASE
jgi:hypothetical protein